MKIKETVQRVLESMSHCCLDNEAERKQVLEAVCSALQKEHAELSEDNG